ncbi:NAD(P)H-dependent oxidoreductase [Pantoea sp. FN0305]
MSLSAELSEVGHLLFVFPVWWYFMPSMLRAYLGCA